MTKLSHSPVPSFLETLEDRIAPATLLVTNINDAGAGSLRDAIDQSNASRSKDVIKFDPSVFTSGTVINLTSGELAITDSVTIKGLGADLVTIDAGDLSRIFNINDGTSKLLSVSLSGLTLSNADAGMGNDGGGIFNAEALSITASSITSNKAGGSGGGIFSDSAGKFILKNSTVAGNSADGSGGGLYLVGSGSAQIAGSLLAGNSAALDGGGAYILTGKSVSLTDLTVASNTTTAGVGAGLNLGSLNAKAAITLKDSSIAGNVSGNAVGGLYVGTGKVTLDTVNFGGNVGTQGVGGMASTGEGSLTIKNSRFQGNEALTSEGGGLSLDGPRAVTISKTEFLANVAFGAGGAIHLDNAVSLKLTGSTIQDNLAETGAGLSLKAGSTAALSKVTLQGNVAAGDGGGFHAADPGSGITMKDSTLLQNGAGGNGGGGFIGNSADFSATKVNFFENGAFGAGGAIASNDADAFSVTKSIFEANSGAKGGGAIFTEGSIFDAIVQSNTFTNNKAVSVSAGGGALALIHNGQVTLSNNIISENEAAGHGGGLLLGGSGEKNLSGNTIALNEAGESGGGVYVALGFSEVSLIKGIISSNTATVSGGGLANASLGLSVAISPGFKISGNVAPINNDVSGGVTIL